MCRIVVFPIGVPYSVCISNRLLVDRFFMTTSPLDRRGLRTALILGFFDGFNSTHLLFTFAETKLSTRRISVLVFFNVALIIVLCVEI